MKRFGVILLIFGIGAFILPFFGLQFRLLSVFGNYTPIAAVVAFILGGILLAISLAGKPAQS